MDISSSQFILVIIFIALLLLFCPCGSSTPREQAGGSLKGGISKGQPCKPGINSCRRGLACLQGVCS